jgi:hypothetical protein
VSALHRADPDIAAQRWNRFEEHIPREDKACRAYDVPEYVERLLHKSSYSHISTFAENTGSINRTGTVHFRKTSVVTMLGAFMGSRASATTASCRTHQITLEFAASDRLPFLNQEEI